jgi:Protein of unknown function (DUF4446)
MQQFQNTLALYFTPNTAIYLLCALVIILTLWIVFLERRVKNLLAGPGSQHLGDTVKHLRGELEMLQVFKVDMEAYLKTVEARLKKSIRGVETVRFNPFKGTGDGGNQSFATALIDEEGNGVVISSIYARDRTSIFSKPIGQYVSSHELSEEELDAIAKAKAKTLFGTNN